MESDRDRDLKNAHKWAVGVINDIAVSKEDKEGLLNDLKDYEQGWMDTLRRDPDCRQG